MIFLFTRIRNKERFGFLLGLGITLVLAIAAKCIAKLPFMSIMGQLVIAILLGMAYRAGIGVPQQTAAGASFSSKKFLRLGIILLGLRLNLLDIVHAGPKVFLLAVFNICFAIFTIHLLSKWFKVEKKLGLLAACGTAICGAAAVVAIAPQIKADDDETALAVATVAILGTIFTLAYTFLYPYLGFSPDSYGIFAGATLHEIAHVIAAAAPGGQTAVDLAVIVKLTRVVMLVPIAIVIGIQSDRKQRRGTKEDSGTKETQKNLPIPWFIIGFLAMSGINTIAIIPSGWTAHLIDAAYMLIAMAMAGLGLGVNLRTIRQLGMRAFAAAGIGSVLLSLLGFLLIHFFIL
ncbi:YeiH family protein [Gorillibacterium massiliense]|uniref:YeiH family protein n=1 Tax=Gorillibacterium massiliense TaxID=1280390 RepID=UPI0012DBFF8E|nr:YeiH family protein [Gorillibacterium massiliense]